jgi:hypothetical protein
MTADTLVALACALGLRAAKLDETFVDEEADLRYLLDALAPDGAAAPAT